MSWFHIEVFQADKVLFVLHIPIEPTVLLAVAIILFGVL